MKILPIVLKMYYPTYNKFFLNAIDGKLNI